MWPNQQPLDGCRFFGGKSGCTVAGFSAKNLQPKNLLRSRFSAENMLIFWKKHVKLLEKHAKLLDSRPIYFDNRICRSTSSALRDQRCAISASTAGSADSGWLSSAWLAQAQ